MHLGKRLAAIVLTCGLSAGLVGCGFHLKGTNPSATPIAYSKMNLVLPKNTDELHEKLAIYLGASGVQLSSGSDAYVLRVLDYKPQRLELNGKLKYYYASMSPSVLKTHKAVQSLNHAP